MHRTVAFIIGLAVLLSMAACASDWPQFRGPHADGTSSETGINKAWNQNPPQLLWKTPMHDDGYAGPSVAKGKVFIIDHEGGADIVRAIDIKTGNAIWEYSYPDAEKENYGFSRSTPAIDGNKVYALGRLGLLNCLDAKTGRLIWSRDIFADFHGQRPTWNYSMSPIVDGKQVVVVPGGPDACVASLDKLTGATIWQGGGSDLPGYATPVIATLDGKRQYVVLTGNSIIGVDTSKGDLLWRYPWPTPMAIAAAASIVIGDDTVFVTTGYGYGCALLKVQSGTVQPIWANKDMQCRFSSPFYLDGYIYGVSEPASPGQLECMNAQTGAVQWKQPGFDFGGIVSVDGIFLVFDGKGGSLVMFKPDPSSYQEIGRFTPLGDQSWTAPIIANGDLIVRNKTALASFSLH